MNVQPAVPRSVYLLIGISLVFVLFSLSADLAFVAILVGILDLSITKSINSYFWTPLIGSSTGLIFGILAKEKARNHAVVLEQGCLVDIFIYLNLIILAVHVFFFCGLVYLAFSGVSLSSD